MYDLTAADQEWFERELAERGERVYRVLLDPRYARHFEPEHSREAIYHYLSSRGKALRPLMLLLCCGAAGGDEERALPAAAAVELFHTWTLVHDDIIDRDPTRRGRSTVHAEFASRVREGEGWAEEEAYHYGVTVAILAGDQQQGWAYSLLAELPECGVSERLALRLVRELALEVEPRLLAGEMLDVQFSRRPMSELREELVLDMLSRKTAVLYSFAARAGALIGGECRGKPDDAEGLARALGGFAGYCGTAFQLRDDLLGITGDEKRLGKPVGSDLREGKKTLIVFHALKQGSERQIAVLHQALGNPAASQGQIAAALDVLEELGSIDYVRSLADRYVQSALSELAVLPDTRYRKLLYLWARYLVARDF